MKSDHISFSQLDARKLISATAIQIGYPSLERASKEVLKKIETIVEASGPFINGRFMHHAVPFQESRKGVVYGAGGFLIESPKLAWLAKSMTGVDHIRCFALTIGPDMDDQIKRAGEDSLLDSVIWDALGSCIAEAFAERVHELIAAECAVAGLKPSARFSPGYCDWPMASGQQAIFRILNPAVIDLCVSPTTGLMIPRKSISAAILAAGDMAFSTPCPRCRKTNCAHRRYPPLEPGADVYA